jgi:PAS domain S-box-containing protein
MKDEERSKEQLLEELRSLRLQLASLKASRSERRQVEQAVRLGENHRGLSLDDIPLAAWIHDNESWRFLMVNQAAIERYGYSREEFLSMTLGDIRPREDMVELEKFLKTASQKRRSTARWRHLKKDGSLIWAICYSHPVELKGQLVRLVVNEDVTEGIRAEAELKSSEAKTRAILSAVPDIMFQISRDGTYLGFYANMTSDLFLPPEKFVGRKIAEVMPSDLAELAMHHIARALDSGITQVFEYVLPMPDGVRHFEARLVASGADEVLAIIRDISDRREAEAEREKLILKLQEAAANIKALSGLLPICAYCKKIRDDQGYWNQVEFYIRRHAEVQFTHGVCPDCARRIVPDVNLE